MNRCAKIICVIICGALLTVLAIQEVFTIVNQVSDKASIIEFQKTPSGVYGDNLLAILMYDVETRNSVSILEKCECWTGFYRNRSQPSGDCMSSEIPVPTEMRTGGIKLLYTLEKCFLFWLIIG